MDSLRTQPDAVMAGLDPAIHALPCEVTVKKDVDARNKSGHDGLFALSE
jgi:hypothetical protein